MVIVVTINSLKRKTGLFNLGYSTHGMHLTQCGCLRLGLFFFFFFFALLRLGMSG